MRKLIQKLICQSHNVSNWHSHVFLTLKPKLFITQLYQSILAWPDPRGRLPAGEPPENRDPQAH